MVVDTFKSLIVAYNNKRVIGKDNKLLWHDKEDLSRFKEITDGNCIIMGRKTHESIGKALLNRTNIIVSRNANYIPVGFPAFVVPSVEAALILAKEFATEEIIFIGGSEIYEQALPLCDVMYLSEFDNDLDGDVFFPSFNEEEWEEELSQQAETHIFKVLVRK